MLEGLGDFVHPPVLQVGLEKSPNHGDLGSQVDRCHPLLGIPWKHHGHFGVKGANAPMDEGQDEIRCWVRLTFEGEGGCCDGVKDSDELADCAPFLYSEPIVLEALGMLRIRVANVEKQDGLLGGTETVAHGVSRPPTSHNILLDARAGFLTTLQLAAAEFCCPDGGRMEVPRKTTALGQDRREIHGT